MRAITFVFLTVVTLSESRTEAGEDEPLPPPSAIISLRDIKNTAARISVDAKELSPELVTCEIGISSALNEVPARCERQVKVFIEGASSKPATAEEFKLVTSTFRIGDPLLHVVFPTGISKVAVGFVAEFKQRRGVRRRELNLEIRPRFKLPSGDEYPFTEMGHRIAIRSQAHRARIVESKREDMFRLLHFGHNMGRFERYRMYQQCDSENRRLQTSVRQDEAARDSISKYWIDIANNANVYVRLVANGATLPAEVAYVK
jgi:hypothetical protein